MVGGYLEVGIDPETFEVVINHKDVILDKDGAGFIAFSPEQARHLANLLLHKADEADEEKWMKHLEKEKNGNS